MKNSRSLREAIQQTRPFESVQVEALLTLTWAEGRVSCTAQASLRECGLSLAQYNVLRILRGSPEGLETHKVVARMLTRAPNITRLVDKLHGKGYLTRTRSTRDRRVVSLHITDSGRSILDRLDKPMQDAAERAMTGLGSDDLRLLIDLLERLQAGLEGSTLACDSDQEEETLR